MIYLIAAFAWWAILLYKNNDESHQLRLQLAQHDATYNISEIDKSYDRQRQMILSEGAVFGLSILLGLMLIYRAFRKELQFNSRMNDFLLSVTHELKTPIATIKLVNKTLKRKDLPGDKRKSLLDTGWEESLRLEQQVTNLLTAAQIDGTYTFNLQQVNLDTYLNDKISGYLRRYPSTTFSYDGVENLHYKIDKEAFGKAIDNLISNAVKYANDIQDVTISLEEEKDNITVSVIDKGIGILDSEKALVWDKFYRVGHEDTRTTQGTGLGLWIVRSVVAAHGGHISVEDNRPQGAIFSIILPRPQSN